MSTKSFAVVATAVLLLLACAGASALAQELHTADYLVLIQEKMFMVKGGKPTELEKAMTLPGGLDVATNGVVTTPEGEKKLQPGRKLTLDGFLITDEGLLVPFRDHLMMQAGRVQLVRDGALTPLQQERRFQNGAVLTPKGDLLFPSGRQTLLLDGNLLALDGTPMPSHDHVMIRDGQVVLQKGGSLLPLERHRRMVMADGTKVAGDGAIIPKDGRNIQLKPDQRLTLPGPIIPEPR